MLTNTNEHGACELLCHKFISRGLYELRNMKHKNPAKRNSPLHVTRAKLNMKDGLKTSQAEFCYVHSGHALCSLKRFSTSD